MFSLSDSYCCQIKITKEILQLNGLKTLPKTPLEGPFLNAGYITEDNVAQDTKKCA